MGCSVWRFGGFGAWGLGFRGLGFVLRLLRGSWAFWGRVWALGARVRDLTTRVQEPWGGVKGSGFEVWAYEPA